jgi:hypothetical protein
MGSALYLTIARHTKEGGLHCDSVIAGVIGI